MLEGYDFASILEFLKPYSNELSALASVLGLVLILLTPLKAIPKFFLNRIIETIKPIYLGVSSHSGVVDAIADPATWASKQTEYLHKHKGNLLVITRSSPFAHENDTYRNRLEDIKQKISSGAIRNAKYIISIRHLINLYQAGLWSKARLLSRLRSLVSNLDPSSPNCVDVETVQICDADFYFTYGIQIYDSVRRSNSFLIFYIEQEDGRYGPSFVVKKHPELLEFQKQHFYNWFNTLCGEMIEGYISSNEDKTPEELSRQYVLRQALIARLNEAIKIVNS